MAWWRLPSLEQVGGVGLGQAADVDAEGGLHHHADDGAEVGVADEQVVHLFRADADLSQPRLRLVAQPLRGVGDFAQGGAQQVVPQPPLDPDGLQLRVLLVEGLEGGDVPLVGGAARSEVLGDSLSVGPYVLQGYQGRVPQPLVEGKPSVRVLQGEGVGAGQTGLACSGPAQKPPLAVGEDAHADPALRRRLSQVVVQLLDVLRVGSAA